MNSPRISVIIPVYNSEKYLKRCIDSILNQTFTDFEALFVDDCSTDRSREIIKGRHANDARIKLIELKQNGGSGIARNVGIENAVGEYLSFIDSDDAVAPDFLELLYQKACESGADVVKGICLYKLEDETVSMIGGSPAHIKSSHDAGAKLYNVFFNQHWCAIYRRGFIEAHGIRYGLTRVSHDVVFLLKVGFFAKSFEACEQATYCYYSNENSAIHTFSYERFVNSLLSVGEVVDFINENDSFSNELAVFLQAFLQRQLPAYSYLLTQERLKDKAPDFLKKLYELLIGFKNLSVLTKHDYALRILVESKGSEFFSPIGLIVGMSDGTQWRLSAFERLVAHLNSEDADSASGTDYLIRSLACIEGYLDRDGESDAQKQRFFTELQAVLLKLNDKSALIEKGGVAARALLECGTNLFFVKKGGLFQNATRSVEIIRRAAALAEAAPDMGSKYREYALRISRTLLRNLPLLHEYYPSEAASISFELAHQIKKLNMLETGASRAESDSSSAKQN